MPIPPSMPTPRGRLQTETDERGNLLGFFIPTENNDIKLKILAGDAEAGKLTIFPIKTEDDMTVDLGPKYANIREIVVPLELEDVDDLADVLEGLPSGLQKDPQYGLGFTRDVSALVSLIGVDTNCSVIDLSTYGEPVKDGAKLYLPLDHFTEIRNELGRITSRGTDAIGRVKHTYIQNHLADILGAEHKQLSLGRLQDSRWITKVAAGEKTYNAAELEAIVSTLGSAAPQIAATQPEKLSKLQLELQLVGLSHLISDFEQRLEKKLGESSWQKFFETNIFILQLLFGGPTKFVKSQALLRVDPTTTKGSRIPDYIFAHSITSNPALVEIKTPQKRLVEKSTYRNGLHKTGSEVAGAVVQVLDQARRLVGHEAQAREDLKYPSLKSVKPRCFVIIGTLDQLTDDDMKNSFELYRESLGSVRLVTFDELLGQLKVLHEYLEDSQDCAT